MWFLSARKAQRTSSARSRRGTFRPRLEALEDRCLLSAGALDPTFGSGGMVSGGPIHFAQTMVIQPNGKIVVGGEYFNASNYAFWGLGRYNANGTLDTTFGNNGVVGLVSAHFGS